MYIWFLSIRLPFRSFELFMLCFLIHKWHLKDWSFRHDFAGEHCRYFYELRMYLISRKQICKDFWCELFLGTQEEERCGVVNHEFITSRDLSVKVRSYSWQTSMALFVHSVDSTMTRKQRMLKLKRQNQEYKYSNPKCWNANDWIFIFI